MSVSTFRRMIFSRRFASLCCVAFVAFGLIQISCSMWRSSVLHDACGIDQDDGEFVDEGSILWPRTGPSATFATSPRRCREGNPWKRITLTEVGFALASGRVAHVLR